jgi:hypothetical protein
MAKKLFDDEPSKDFEDRLFQRVDAILDERAAAKPRAGLLDWLFRPAFGMSLAAAGAAALVIVYLHAPTDRPAQVAFMGDDPEMVRDADMLMNLDLLREWPALEKMEKKREWKKKRG